MIEILIGAAALGIIWSVMTLGTFISYRVLDIADLTVEGSIGLGGAVAAILIFKGVNPYVAALCALLSGMAAGFITGILITALRIPPLLSGILCMIALYSINIRVMLGAANVSLLRKSTVFSVFTDMGLPKNISVLIIGAICVLLVILIVYWFFGTEAGCAIRATGNSPQMARAQGVNINIATVTSLTISNGLVGLSGGLIAQYLGFSDVQMGTGSIVIGLASLIIGEVLFGRRSFKRALVSMVAGSVVYRVIIALVLEAGMPATDLKLFTAITVAAALCLPRLRGKIGSRARQGR